MPLPLSAQGWVVLPTGEPIRSPGLLGALEMQPRSFPPAGFHGCNEVFSRGGGGGV